MRRFSVISAIALMAVFFSMSSCGRIAENREDAIKKLIGRYTFALTSAYKDGNFSELTKVSAGGPLNLADNSYQAYNNNGMVLDAELLGLTFKKIELGSGEDESKIKVEWFEKDKEWHEIWIYKETFVETEERWRYKWVDNRTGELASPLVTARYDMRYTIDYVGKSLRVVSAEMKKEEIEKEEGSADRWKTVVGGVGAH